MDKLWRAALSHPRFVVACAALVVLAALPGLARLELALDGRSLLPASAPEVERSRAIQSDFGVDDQIALVLRAPPGGSVLTVRALGEVERLSRAVAELPGVRIERVTSLATEPGDTVRTGTLDFRAWLDPLPATDAEVERLARALARAPVYRGTLLSTDERVSATAILVRVAPDADREALCRELRALCDGYAVDGHALLLVGAPVAEAELGRHLLADLGRLVPLALLVIGVLFFLAFGVLRFVALPLLGAGVANVVVFGALGWSGAPVQLTCLIVPVILTAVGIADAIHLFDLYRHELLARPLGARRAAWEATLKALAGPVVGTSLTTAAGFASFAFAPLPAVRALGIALALGTLVCLAWSLCVLPVLASFGGETALRGARASARSRIGLALGERLGRLAASVARHRGRVLGCALLLLIACAFGAARVRVQDSWVDGFDPESRVARASAAIDELFGGTHLLRVAIEPSAGAERFVVERSAFDGESVLLPWKSSVTPPTGAAWTEGRVRVTAVDAPDANPSDLRATAAAVAADGLRLTLVHPTFPNVRAADCLPQGSGALAVEVSSDGRMRRLVIVHALREFERALSAHADLGVGAVIGPWSHLSSLHSMISGAPDTERVLLGTQQGLERAFDLYARNRGERRTREVWSAGFDRALVTLLVRHANYERVRDLLDAVRRAEREHLAPVGLRVELAGDLAESQAMITAIVRSQVMSLCGSILMVALLVALGLRSLRLGLVGIVPCTLGAFATFGLMGAASIPLGVATSMFGAMAIGIGDDHAVHWLERFRRARALGLGRPEATVRAATEAGPAIVVDALAVATGLAVLCVSAVPTNARLGFLLVASMLAALVATLLLLPALLGGGRERV